MTTTLVFAPEARDDLERIFDFYAEHDVLFASLSIKVIMDGFELIRRHPMAGKKFGRRMRQIHIGKEEFVFSAVYFYDDIENNIEIRGIKHQRERRYAKRPARPTKK